MRGSQGWPENSLPGEARSGVRPTCYPLHQAPFEPATATIGSFFLYRPLGTAKVLAPFSVLFRMSFCFFPLASRLHVELTIVVKFGDLLFIPSRFNAAAMPATCMNSPGVRDKKSTIAFATLIFVYLPVLARVGAFSGKSSSTLSIASTFCLRPSISRCNCDFLKINSSLVINCRS